MFKVILVNRVSSRLGNVVTCFKMKREKICTQRLVVKGLPVCSQPWSELDMQPPQAHTREKQHTERHIFMTHVSLPLLRLFLWRQELAMQPRLASLTTSCQQRVLRLQACTHMSCTVCFFNKNFAVDSEMMTEFALFCQVLSKNGKINIRIKIIQILVKSELQP